MSLAPTSPLISATGLLALQAGPAPALLLDCSFDLADTAAGRRQFEADGHLPGAHHLHLDEDLSGPKTGRNGRHPLPARDVLAARLGALGLQPGRAVVAYDRQGAMYAARAWWLLRWLGHADVRVLDGGWAAWQAAGGAVATGPSPAPAAGAAPYPASATPGMPTLDADALAARLGRVHLLDARAPERYRGEVEPLDARAGHIPGASNRFFKLNLAADGRFLPAEALRAAFAARGAAAADTVHQCGSGVTACHNLLAMELAGLPGALLYPGSWSEWSSDPARPAARSV